MTTRSERAVLVVDPDEGTRTAATAALTEDDSAGLSLTVESVSTFEAAVDAFTDRVFDCVVTEYDLPDNDGLELVGWVRDNAPDVACVLYTDVTPEGIRTAAFESVVVEYLPKDLPGSTSVLVRLVTNMLTQGGQLSYPVPKNEDERLAALRQYDVEGMDTVDSIDRITELVSRQFDVAVAFAGVIDAHEERFLACKGADWDRLDREDSICTHTVLEEDYLVIEDVQTDTRFSAIDRLVDLDIRAYAGVPLKTPDGLPIGALCLIHDEPRSFSATEIETLTMYAEELMEQLELRRQLGEYQVTEEATQ